MDAARAPAKFITLNVMPKTNKTFLSPAKLVSQSMNQNNTEEKTVNSKQSKNVSKKGDFFKRICSYWRLSMKGGSK